MDRHDSVSTPQRGRGRNAALVALALALGALVWWLQLDEPEPEARPRRAPAAKLGATRPAPVAPEPASPKLTSVAPPQEPTPEPDSYDTHPGQPSHPITPERLRIYRENHFIHSVDNAILVKDYEAIRRFNAEYRKEYPADGHALQDAYDMIADCLEEKTPERVARAREFWETRRSSQARRDLRRICLE